jgi:histidine triad (HIT) family protein
LAQLQPDEQKKQEMYRDARVTGEYDSIWQSVNKCVFCDLREKYIIFEENGIVMTITLYAYIDGHFMIVPRRHVRSARELSQLEWDTVRKFLYIAKKMIRDVHGIKGMQLVQKDGSVAQSTVEHMHFHCVPFDAPDLSVWNYRKLKHTPLENVAKYKADHKKIIEYGTKYSQKYSNPSGLPVNVTLIAINTRSEVLLQERPDDMRIIPNYLTPPGGAVQDFSVPLIDELAREVREENGLKVNRKRLKLIDSRIGSVKRKMISKPLRVAYRQPHQFLWNSYLQTGIPADTALIPGDDCKEIVWVKLSKVAAHPRITPEVKEIIGIARKQYGAA